MLMPGSWQAEHETKFILANQRAMSLVHWLRLSCSEDPVYATGRVSSIYFDTLQWRYLDEKRNSDYLKTKVRIRWYSDLTTGKVLPGAFLEAKFKVGSSRKKIRLAFEEDSSWLSNVALHNSRLTMLKRLLAEQGLVVHDQLIPVFQIDYMRYRFIDSLSGARLCVDRNIRVDKVNPRMIPTPKPVRLQHAVFEFKDRSGELPDWMHQATALGCQKEAFSKYYCCYEELTRGFS